MYIFISFSFYENDKFITFLHYTYFKFDSCALLAPSWLPAKVLKSYSSSIKCISRHHCVRKFQVTYSQLVNDLGTAALFRKLKRKEPRFHRNNSEPRYLVVIISLLYLSSYLLNRFKIGSKYNIKKSMVDWEEFEIK